MNSQFARAASRLSLIWDGYKRPVKRMYQIPAVGAAFLYRRLLTGPVYVGITGSLGKTQHKSLIAAVLSARGKVQYDPGTDNRTYDAAKNLLQLRPSHSACVQEIGLAGPNTMARPVRLFRPDIAVITNIRSDHGEEFASRREQVLEKATIIRSLPENGWAILNADEPDLDILIGETRAKVLTFGLAEHADVRGTNVVTQPPRAIALSIRYDELTQNVSTRLHGVHNVYSVLAAAAVGVAVGVSARDVAEAIKNVDPIPGRMQYREHADGVRFLLDDFKASVDSLGAIADYLRAFDAGNGRKILVLGSITYGDTDPTEDYVRVIESVVNCCDQILLVGSMANQLNRSRLPSTVDVFATTRQCADHLLPRLKSGDLVVLKCRNTDEHLRRLEIGRRSTVNCWQMSCRKKTFCNDCRFVEEHLD